MTEEDLSYTAGDLTKHNRIASSIIRYIASTTKRKRIRALRSAANLIMPKSAWEFTRDSDGNLTVPTFYPFEIGDHSCIAVKVMMIAK